MREAPDYSAVTVGRVTQKVVNSFRQHDNLLLRLRVLRVVLPPKVFDEERTAGGQADAGIEVEFYNRAVAMRQYRIAYRQVEQLPGVRRRQGERFFARIGRLARDELRMRRVS